MKKLVIFLAVFPCILILITTPVYPSGQEEVTQENEEFVQNEEEEKLPETNIIDNSPVLIGIVALTLSIAVYKIQVDIAKIQKRNFENRIVRDCEK